MTNFFGLIFVIVSTRKTKLASSRITTITKNQNKEVSYLISSHQLMQQKQQQEKKKHKMQLHLTRCFFHAHTFKLTFVRELSQITFAFFDHVTP